MIADRKENCNFTLQVSLVLKMSLTMIQLEWHMTNTILEKKNKPS